MALIVQKYGGTSVGSTDRIQNVARRVARYHREGHQLVVVVSAMSGETNRLLALAKELSADPESARARRRRGHRRAGDDRPPGHRARGDRHQGPELHRRPGQGPHRQRVHQGADPVDRRRGDAGRSRGPAPSSSSPVSRASTTTATSRRSGAAARTPPASRWPRRSRPTSARSTPTSTASTRPTRASSPRRGGSTRITFEEMLEMASLGLEGAADPLGRVRRQVQRAAAGAVVVRGSRSRRPRARSSPTRKTSTWKRPSSPASRSTATRPRSR